MSVRECTKNGKPGYKCGNGDYCYTYDLGDAEGRKFAEQMARFQEVAIETHRRAKE